MPFPGFEMGRIGENMLIKVGFELKPVPENFLAVLHWTGYLACCRFEPHCCNIISEFKPFGQGML
jgi:hypothetical protein